MKRLTMKDENGYYLKDKSATITWNSLIGENRYRGEAIDRLAAIEDILCDDTDEYDLDRLRVLCNQRMTMRGEVSQRFSLTAKIPLDRLRELVEMDSAGCIPPCKIGDVFYRVCYGFDSPEIEKYRVSMVTQKADRSWRIRATDTESSFQIDWSLDDFSKRAYKTREEAEAALAKIAD